MAQEKSPIELGTQKVGKLLIQYAIPAIIAMTASSLYNMIDSIFIGHGVGPLAISGLAITFPLMNLAAAFGSLVGVGAATLVSVKLGQRDYGTAKNVLGNVVILNLIIGTLFTVITLPFLDNILYFFGASPDTIGYARDYMKIILVGNVVTHLYLGLNSVLRSSGHPRKAMVATIATVVLNTVLDALFIFVFDWGIQGAAIATVVAQVLALIWLLKIFSDKKQLIRFEKSVFRLKKKIVFDSLAIGMAPFLMNMASCFIVILINNGLKKYGGDFAIGAFGIVNRLIFLFVMIVMGLNQGMQPIAGYNFGAKQYQRVDRVLKLTIGWATVITTIGFIVGMFFPEAAVSMFTSDIGLIERASRGFRLVVLFFPIVGVQMVTSNFFQSIGMANKAIFLSLTRQVLLLIPCLVILPRFWGETGVWISMPISDFIATIIAAVMLWMQINKFKKMGSVSF